MPCVSASLREICLALVVAIGANPLASVAEELAAGPMIPDAAKIVGSDECAKCHENEVKQWMQTPHFATFESENVVKVVVDDHDFALYFSRADLAGATRGGPALRHAGVYAFRRDLLLEFASWPPGKLELAERLEQLRAVERGVRIFVVRGARPFSGVDTPEQMAALEARGPVI